MLRGIGEGNAWPLSLRQASRRSSSRRRSSRASGHERKRRGEQPAPASCSRAAERGAGHDRRVVRATRYAVKPMSIEDAALRVDGGPRRSSSSATPTPTRVSILYRRKDGNLGLIEPDRSGCMRIRIVGSAERMPRSFDSTAGVTVATLLRDLADSRGLDLELLAGADGLDRRITIPHTQKTGLALSGFDAYLRGGRVLVFGESEIRFLETLPSPDRIGVLRRVLEPRPAVPAGHRRLRRRRRRSPIEADRARRAAAAGPAPPRRRRWRGCRRARHLSRARAAIVHGVLMDILGLGVLVIGESGIGKSECALDLVVRGHRLVADDAVELRCRAESFVLGSCPELTRHHMEIRGLGLINVQDLFGVASTRTSKRVELVVQLERWEPGREYDRLGIDDDYYELLGHPHPDDPDAGRARPQHRDPGRGGGAEPAAADARPSRGAPAGRAAERAARRGGRCRRRSSSRERISDAREAARRAPRGADGGARRGSSC